MEISSFCPGVGDLRRHSCPQEHHRVQPGREAGAERRSSAVAGGVRRGVRHDVARRHRHRHQRDGGAVLFRSPDPGRPGGTGGGNLCLHHLPGNPPPRAQLIREAAAQSALHPAGLRHHGRPHPRGLRQTGVVSPARDVSPTLLTKLPAAGAPTVVEIDCFYDFGLSCLIKASTETNSDLYILQLLIWLRSKT